MDAKLCAIDNVAKFSECDKDVSIRSSLSPLQMRYKQRSRAFIYVSVVSQTRAQIELVDGV
jgi:hypothetical protein